jgi:hydroxyacylglutathione hydrolase
MEEAPAPGVRIGPRAGAGANPDAGALAGPIVETFPVGGNLNYLLACPRTGEAVAIDPVDPRPFLALAAARGYRIARILVTHEHSDHVAGIAALQAATGARCLAHPAARGEIPSEIPGQDDGLVEGDRVAIGESGTLRVLEVPGHTLRHLAFFLEPPAAPALFCGDTLFGAGVGNCRHGGDAGRLFATVERLRATLPPATRIHPGHDYLANNLRFALDREPDNAPAAALLAGLPEGEVRLTTLAEEAAYNPFFRLTAPGVLQGLRRAFPGLPEAPDRRTVFLHLRELRDRW